MAMLGKIVIVGDSFMKPDPAYPGQHFSEMLESSEIVILSQDGSSMGMIMHQIVQAITQQPDGIIIGFTSQDRLEWLRDDKLNKHWIPSAAAESLTSEQFDLDVRVRAQSDAYMNDIKGHAMASGVMTLLHQLKIPFAWTANLLYANPHTDHYELLNTMLRPFDDRRTETDFTRYGKYVSSPGFHVDDPFWQQKFAHECFAILTRQG